jgi:hypothetical protein
VNRDPEAPEPHTDRWRGGVYPDVTPPVRVECNACHGHWPCHDHPMDAGHVRRDECP